MLHKNRVSFTSGILALFCSMLASAQGAGAPGPGGQPGSAQLAPPRDLSGIWSPSPPFAGVAPTGIRTSPLTAAGEALAQANKPGDGPRRARIADINDPHTTACDPAGFPRVLLFELRPFQFVQTANQVLVLYSYEQRWRVVWTDGRPLPTDPDPKWYGYSSGRWEDDFTFVVETTGTDERSWLDNAGNPHSPALRVVERYQRIDADTMELTVTIHDPAVYTAPFNARDRLRLTRMPADTDVTEMLCISSEASAYHELMAIPAQPKD